MTTPSTLRFTTLLAIVPITMVSVVIFAWFAGMLTKNESNIGQQQTEPAVSVALRDSLPEQNESGSHSADSFFQMAAFRNPLRPQQQNSFSVLEESNSANDVIGVEETELSKRQPIIKLSLSSIDEYILVGRYSKAAEIMADFAPRAPTSIKDKIQLRQGLCAELMGKYEKALDFYRALTGPSHPRQISIMATVSAARLLIDKGNRKAGNFLLMQLLISRESSLDEHMRGEVLHTLAWGLAYADEDIWLLDDDAFVVANRRVTPEELLQRWNQLSDKTADSTINARLSVQRLTDDPGGVFVSVHANSATLANLFDSVSSRLKWKLDCTHEVRLQLAKRSAEFSCNDLPLDILLDSILLPRGWTWEFSNGTLRINSNQTAQSEEPPKAVAVRFLELATSLAPDHPAAASSYLVLGTTAAQFGKANDAIHFFQLTQDLYPKTPQAGVTTFNMGKVALKNGDRDTALQHFYRTVDRVTSIDIDTAAFIYVGRMLMENDTPGDAIEPLMRGLALSQGTPYEGAAAMQLASAFLMNKNADAANAVLMNHRHAYEIAEDAMPRIINRQAAISKHAALLSCLTRFWGSEGPQRLREGRALMQALTVAQQDTMFGGHADYLLGVAYAAVGLDGEQAAAFKKSLTSKDRFPLQQRMRSLLAQTGNKDYFADAVTMNPSDVQPSKIPMLIRKQEIFSQTQAAFRQGDYQAVLGNCEEFLQIPQTAENPEKQTKHDELSRKMLRLMGLAYQALGRHEAAVKCFAGIPQ